MVKKKLSPIVLIIIAILGYYIVSKGGIFTGVVAPDALVIRTISPSIIEPNSVATISYHTTGATDKFGGVIKETIPTGYSNPTLVSGLEIKITGDLVEIPFTQTSLPVWTLDSPSEGGSNIYGTFEFAPNVEGEVGVSGEISGHSIMDVCGDVCSRPIDLCVEAVTVYNDCGQNCGGTWTVTRKTDGDINCDDSVSNQELLDYISLWVIDQATNQQLLSVITGWVNSP